MRSLIVLLLLLAVPHAPAAAEDAHWIGSWGAAPLQPTPAFGPFPASPSFDDQTIRQVVRISAGGTRLRLRLSNEYGTKPLAIGGASVALAKPDGTPGKKSIAVTFGGKKSAIIPPGAPLASDPIDLPTKDLDTISVSLYVSGDTGQCTCHATGLQDGFVSDKGDFTKKDFKPKDKISARAFLSGIAVETEKPAKTIVVLGDSISDGVGSTAGADHRWPDLLAQRLSGRSDGTEWGVVNVGISGNQILNDGAGQSALARFDRDVLAVPGAAYVIMFEGINDIGISYGNFKMPRPASATSSGPPPPPPHVTAEQLIAGYQQIIARAHGAGLKVIGATITPYKGAAYYAPEGEKVREKVNDWIRTNNAFDAVIDFDKVIRDPKDLQQMADGLHMGDHLHGSDAGYKAMADAIDLSIFR
ncbi:MAG: SGNH/GDSL hydrolase family protein [Alphaproteobacteria bacterium]